jgi:DNA-binding beta-propeller fold protein YncE
MTSWSRKSAGSWKQIPALFGLAMASLAASAQQPLINSIAATNYPYAVVVNSSSNEAYLFNSDYSLQYINGSSDQVEGTCPATLNILFSPEFPGESPGVPANFPGAGFAADAKNNLLFLLGADANGFPNAGVMSENAFSGNCSPSAVASLQGALNLGSLVAVDSAGQKVYVVNQQNGSDPDILDVVDYSAAPYTVTSYNLDNNAIYSGVVVDPASGFVFVSEGQNTRSNSSLYVFNPSNQTITQVVGPGGQSLPAVAIYSIPNPANATNVVHDLPLKISLY